MYMAIELEVKEIKTIEEGKHTGKITRIEERTEPYHYIDIFIELENGIELKYGCPASISTQSKLGKTLNQFTELEPGEKINIEKTLVGKKVTFMTINETTDRGTFARIVDGSIKPAK